MALIMKPPPVQRASARPSAPPVEDGARELLRAGISIVLVGAGAFLLVKTVFGGIGVHGPHTNSGWLSLILAMMCLPFGAMLSLLGAAKWLRRRRLAAGGAGSPFAKAPPDARS